MASLSFSHPKVGNLVIDTGIDQASWAYGLNTMNYPTYGGEVIQILSVYIDNLTLQGTISTYHQMEAIFSYFTKYMGLATQGNNASQMQQGSSSYNLEPMYFYYDERNWTFKIYPLAAPGFGYGIDTVAPVWQMQAHIIDDSPDLSVIQDGIKGATISAINSGTLDVASQDMNQFNATVKGSIVPNENMNTQFSLSGNLSPNYTNPNTDPFETADPKASKTQTDAGSLADYYSTLIGSYTKKGFSQLLSDIGSQPVVTPSKKTHNQNVTIPSKTAAAGAEANTGIENRERSRQT